MRVMLSVLDVTKAPLPCEAHMVKATKQMLQILILDVYPTKNMKEKKKKKIDQTNKRTRN